MIIKKRLVIAIILLMTVGCQPIATVNTTEEIPSTRSNQLTPSSNQFTPIPTFLNVLQATDSTIQMSDQTPMISAQITITPSTMNYLQKIAPSELRKYIGIIYPPVPTEIKGGGPGGIIFSPNGAPDYLLEGFYKEDIHMLWFSKLINRDSQGNYWQVLDILVLPKLENDEVFIPSGCMLKGKLDDELIAIGVLDDEAYKSRYLPNDHIKYVWRTNRAAEVFQQLPTDGVECYADNATTW